MDATCKNWSGTSGDLSGVASLLMESSKPAKGFAMASPPSLFSCCLDCEGARAEGIGEELELFMTLLGLTGGLGVGSLGTERGAGGSKKSKADAMSIE